MQTPSEKQSSRILCKLGKYSAAKLNSNSKTKQLASVMRDSADKVKKRNMEKIDLEEDLMEKEALSDTEDESLDATIKAFSDALYNSTGRDRKSPRYSIIFPKGSTPFTKPRLFKQVKVTKSLIILLKSIKDDPTVDKYLPIIEQGLKALEESLELYQETLDNLDTAKSAEYVARMQFVTNYISTYGAVVKIMGSKRHAEPFFKKFRNKNRK